MSISFVHRTLTDNRRLFALMHSFNFHPALHIHPQRFDGLVPVKALHLLLNSRRGERLLSRWAIEHWGLATGNFWDFGDPRRRLALIDPPQLDELICYAGAAVHWQSISRAIDRKTHQRFKEALSDQAYYFAVKRAPLLCRGLPMDWFPAVKPGKPVLDVLEETGRRCLSLCLFDSPDELRRRVALKLRQEATLDVDGDVDGAARERVWSMVNRILLTEVTPELKPCFN